MGESTCLARSFSTPADTSCIALETNPMRMLGESISFGRFMSESLDWGRWSTFSQNRYVEEAEKYSKPGFVAAKKAFFEAHYKKTVKSATSIQEENAHVDGTSNSETHEGNGNDSMVEMKPKADNVVVHHAISYQAAENADSDAINYQTINHAEVVECELDISNMEGAGDVPHPHADANVKVESYILVDNSNQFFDVEVHNKNTVDPVEERMPDHGTAGHEALVSPIKETEVKSPKLSTKTRASHNERKAAATLPPKIGISKKSVRDSVENRRPTSRSLHISVHLPSGASETRKTAASSVQSRNGMNCVSKSKKSVGGLVEKSLTERSLHMSVNLPSSAGERSKAVNAAVKPRNHASKSVKSVGESVQRQTARSLHMSINLQSNTGETRKTALVFEHNRTEKVHSNLARESVPKQTARSLHMSINLPSGTGETSKTALFEHNRTKKVHSNLDNISKDHPMASGTSTKADNGFSKQASDNSPSQGRRTERPLKKSASGGVTANAKFSSISVDCLKSSSITKSNQQFPTKSLPYRFKSEERALKRKEFLPRMDETKNKEEEKVPMQRIHKMQEKTDHDDKKLRQSSSSQPKLNGDRHDESHRPSNQIRKISLTQPRSPKLGRKTSSSTVPDKNCGHSWKPPISTNNPKRISEKKNNRTTKQSVSSLSIITRENASPNVQH